MEMEEEYGMMDQINPYMNERQVFAAIPQPPRDLSYAMVMLGGGGVSFGSNSTTGMLSTTSGFSGDSGSGSACGNGLYMDEIGGRWSKEETLALLDIRSKFDSQFKKANHKGILWEQVSRIMYAEHGYKRSGKKCSVKFENLYKYYKKIKEGKIGRQEKKNYRFFSQLEGIYGETINTSTNLSLTNATLGPFMEENDRGEKTINKRSLQSERWKTVITDYIEAKMSTLMEKQEKWMQKVMNTIEEKENERISKEVQRRKLEEVARLDMEKRFRSKELAWMQSRDSTLMEALHKLTKNESTIKNSCAEYGNHQNHVANWGENDITQLIQLRSGMEARFEESGFMENVLWEEIALTMANLGYNKSALMCEAKWDHINFLLRNKKQKGCSNYNYVYYDDNYNHIIHEVGERFVSLNAQQNECGNRVFMSDNEMMWNNSGNM